jgi:hypothetical protein
MFMYTFILLMRVCVCVWGGGLAPHSMTFHKTVQKSIIWFTITE